MHIRVPQLLIAFLLLLVAYCAPAQTIQVLTSGTKTSIRGLSVVNDDVLWASGSNGTVARSVDGGKTFSWITVKGYEQRDFRDVEAFDANTAIIMAIAEPAVILKTRDGGKHWKKVFEDSTKGMFLDAMDFYDEQMGIVVGDPIESKVFMATTSDGAEHWESIEKNNQWLSKDVNRSVVPGEAMFAASGTNVKLLSDGSCLNIYKPAYVTGGAKSSFCSRRTLPMIQGKETQGANSIACRYPTYVIVGGDFANDKDTTGNCVIATITDSFKFDFIKPQTPPHGYRSCVEFITDNQLITCGTSGVDISNDGGTNWTLISPESFHVCQKAKKGSAVFLAGKDGRIARLLF